MDIFLDWTLNIGIFVLVCKRDNSSSWFNWQFGYLYIFSRIVFRTIIENFGFFGGVPNLFYLPELIYSIFWDQGCLNWLQIWSVSLRHPPPPSSTGDMVKDTIKKIALILFLVILQNSEQENCLFNGFVFVSKI